MSLLIHLSTLNFYFTGILQAYTVNWILKAPISFSIRKYIIINVVKTCPWFTTQMGRV